MILAREEQKYPVEPGLTFEKVRLDRYPAAEFFAIEESVGSRGRSDGLYRFAHFVPKIVGRDFDAFRETLRPFIVQIDAF
jgi:hypothetical protein